MMLDTFSLLSSYDYFAQGANSATEIAFLLFKIQQIFEHGIEKNVSNIPNCFIFAPNYKNQLDEKITECIGFNSFNLCWNY
jgi:hypothetical protein